MAVSGIKKEADRLPHDEVVYLAAWFQDPARRRDFVYSEGLDLSWQAVESGDRISLDQYKRLSNDLDKSGL